MPEQKVWLMLADPDMDKVRNLISKLSNFHWSLKLPEQCVLSDGSGLGRLAYDNIAAFNIAWCFHKPVDTATHNAAIVTFVQLREPLKFGKNNISLEDAIMFLPVNAFKVWVKQTSDRFHPSLVTLLLTAANNYKTH